MEKIAQRVTYEKLKFKDGKDVEIYVNLIFIYFNWHGPSNLVHSD